MSDKKVLFLELNSSYSHSMPGYCMIRALAEQEAPDWTWGNFEANLKTPPHEIICGIETFAPDILLATGYIFNLRFLLEICSQVKKIYPELNIFLGGPSFLGDNEIFLHENPCVSGVIRGDESSIPDLLKSKDMKCVAGLCFLDENNNYNDNQRAEYEGDLDELPSPYQQGINHKNKTFYQLETSRGCGGACSFCTSSKSKGVKYHSLDRVKDDLTVLHGQGYRDIRLIDRTFNDDAERALTMLKLFNEEFSDMRFHIEIHPERLKPEILKQLAKAEKGSLHLEAGIQSFDPLVLKNIRRSVSYGKAESGLKELISLNNLDVHADLISGLPGQNLNSLLNDINKMLEAGPDEIQLETLKLLPGTDLRENPPPGLEYNTMPPWQVMKTGEMNSGDLAKAALYSYILDSWYNPPALQNVFRFAFKRIDNFFIKFCDFIEPYCDLSQGKMPLERRFDLLEDFLEKFDDKSLELCCFSKIASGFRCEKADLQKYSNIPCKEIIWKRSDLADDVKIKRCIILDCDFNTADFWLDAGSEFIEAKHKYIFKLHYGRNVASIVSQ